MVFSHRLSLLPKFVRQVEAKFMHAHPHAYAKNKKWTALTSTTTIPFLFTARNLTYTLDSGSHEQQGRRETMEDTHVHWDVFVCEGPAPFSKVSYYGVYDGHGGVQNQIVNCTQPYRKIPPIS
jgi:hypothetical protein